ncbi:MAG: hypothetical protein AAGA75_08060 [Cyanobacteria bacterium P01_E01_bin.6]
MFRVELDAYQSREIYRRKNSAMQESALHSIYTPSSESLSISSLRDSLMLSSSNLESQLLNFVIWALRQSRSPQFTTTARMEILERAWQAQKKIWEIRNTQLTLSSKQRAQWN